MKATFEPDTCWERILSELRAQRAAQKRAWGDLDNMTLGRYLAGEVSADERAEIEEALAALPELRDLTDLVRSVLADFEPATVPVPAVPEPPAVFPFRRPAARRTPLRRQRYALCAAAAGLLLAVGLGIIQTAHSPASLADHTQTLPTLAAASPRAAKASEALPDDPNPMPHLVAKLFHKVVLPEEDETNHGQGFTAALLDKAVADGEREDDLFARAAPADEARLLDARTRLVALYDAQSATGRTLLRTAVADKHSMKPAAGGEPALTNRPDRRRGPDLEKRVAVLHYCLRHGDGATQARAAGLLGDLGTAADAAVPDLVRVLGHSEDPQVEAAARSALVRLAPSSAPRLALLVLTGDARERKAASEILHHLNPPPGR